MSLILFNIFVVFFAFTTVKLIQKLIDVSTLSNELKIGKTRSEIEKIYDSYEEDLEIEKAPLNILRGITIQFKIENDADKNEFIKKCKKMREKHKSSALLFFLNRLGKVAMHSLGIIMIAIFLNATKISLLIIPMVILSMIVSLTKKYGARRFIFNMILFAYFGYFLTYTIVLYIALIRLYGLLNTSFNKRGVKNEKKRIR